MKKERVDLRMGKFTGLGHARRAGMARTRRCGNKGLRQGSTNDTV